MDDLADDPRRRRVDVRRGSIADAAAAEFAEIGYAGRAGADR
jgi:hypothetical protein